MENNFNQVNGNNSNNQSQITENSEKNLELNNKKLPEFNAKVDYYSNSMGKKIGDFFIGFFGYFILFFVLGIITSRLGQILNDLDTNFIIIFNIISIIFMFIILTGVCYLCIKKGRKYITIGIIAFILTPLLLFGGCFMLLTGEGFLN